MTYNKLFLVEIVPFGSMMRREIIADKSTTIEYLVDKRAFMVSIAGAHYLLPETSVLLADISLGSEESQFAEPEAQEAPQVPSQAPEAPTVQETDPVEAASHKKRGRPRKY